MKQVLIWTVVTIVIVGGGLAILRSVYTAPVGGLSDPVGVGDHMTARTTAGLPVTLVEYADFQCPACAGYQPILKQLQQDYVGRVNFVYRYYPLPTLHVNAYNSAYAAEAAGLQGKFWEMHDMLFEHQNDWATSTTADTIFEGYATKLGLNITKFKSDVALGETQVRVKHDMSTGDASGVVGTPTYFLNGKIIQNPAGLDAFKQLLDQTLAGK